jgi:hypothetical protein
LSAALFSALYSAPLFFCAPPFCAFLFLRRLYSSALLCVRGTGLTQPAVDARILFFSPA